MPLCPLESLTNIWIRLNPCKHCSLQADEVKSLPWLLRGGWVPAVGTAATAEALSLSKQSQESVSSIEGDGFAESSADYFLKNMPISDANNVTPAYTIRFGRRMLQHLNSQIQQAELDLGQQLLGCKEPYHRLCSLTQHFHVARQSLEDITCHANEEELHKSYEEGHDFQHNLQSESRDMVLHPDPEIYSRQINAAMIARAFIGDPAGILRDILSIQTYAVLMAQ